MHLPCLICCLHNMPTHSALLQHAADWHLDVQILEPPAGAETLATSKTARHEIWVLHDRIMGIQGHPEFTCWDFLHKIHPYLTRNGCPPCNLPLMHAKQLCAEVHFLAMSKAVSLPSDRDKGDKVT